MDQNNLTRIKNSLKLMIKISGISLIIFAGLSYQSTFALLLSSPIVKSSSNLNETPPCVDPDLLPAQAKVPCAVILEFGPGTSKQQRAKAIKNAGASLRFNYDVIDAAAVSVPNLKTYETLKHDPSVLKMIPDRPVHATVRPENPGNKPKNTTGQTVPEGIKHIGASPGQLSFDGSGIGVGVVDTGIDNNHVDLSVAPECYTFTNTCFDGNGHGTHVAGTIAALDNDKDVVGVAPGSTTYAIKVLSDNGSGSDSTVMAGLLWVYSATINNTLNPPIKVVNMSLGRGGTLNDNPLLRDTVRMLKDEGITVVVAAGNSSNAEVTQMVPATYPEVIAVASSTAADSSSSKCRSYAGVIAADTASYFSTDGQFNPATNIGVTISAPGEKQENISRRCTVNSVGILSLKAGGGTTRMSGTSMASPHVAGTAALIIQAAGGMMDPELVRDKLRNSADLINSAPFDSPTVGYTFDNEREGILSACNALGESC